MNPWLWWLLAYKALLGPFCALWEATQRPPRKGDRWHRDGIMYTWNGQDWTR